MTATARLTRSRALARGLLGFLVLIAASWAALLLTVPSPAGDPALVAVSPADGELVRSPDEVRLTFDRPVQAGLATVRLTVPDGGQVGGRPHAVPGDPATIAVGMPPTRYGGTYSVAWSVPSGTLEPITGRSAFHVFAPSTPVAVPQIPTDRDPWVVGIHVAFQAAAAAAFVVGVGVAFVVLAVWPAGAAAAQTRRTITGAWWVLVVTTLGAAGSLGGYGGRLPPAEAYEPTVVSAAFATDIGTNLLVRLLVLVPCTIALIQLLTGQQATTGRQRWLRAGMVLGGAAAPAATWALARPHGPDQLSVLAVGAETALLLAAAACVGGPLLLWILKRTAGAALLRSTVARLARLMPAAGVVLLGIAPFTTAGALLIALVTLGVITVGSGLAAGWWVRRRTRTRGRALTGRPARAEVAR